MIMEIVIAKAPDLDMPYDTVADWRYNSLGQLVIKYVDLGAPNFELLLWHHEFVEAILCEAQGITVAQVDEYDEQYEAKREYGDDSEPGDQVEAPYHWAHTSAELSERALAASLRVVWGEYTKAIDEAFIRVRKARRAAGVTP